MGWIDQISRALEKWGSISLKKMPRTIVVTGMGGSGCVGDYIYSLAWNSGKASAPIIVVKNYRLPSFVSEKDLVFVISYSGNTLETIKAYRQAISKGSMVVIVTSNGYLLREAYEKEIPLIKVKEGLVPRTALPEMLYGVLGVLDSSGISIVSKEEARKSLEFLKREINNVLDTANKLAETIHESNRNLVIATHTPLEVLAIRGKNEFNENSKIPVKIEVSPEWAHNDIVGWEKPVDKNWLVIILSDPVDKVGENLANFMEEVYREAGLETYTIELKGDSLLEKLIYGSLLFGLASVKLARLRNINPLETKSIRKYKERVDKVIIT